MQSRRWINIVNCHAAGEVGDVITGGVAPPPGATLWDQARWIDRDGELRDFVLNEPRGGVFRHVNLLVPPRDPRAQMGFIIMEPAHTPPMSGSNAICVATVLLETGILPMDEPVTELVLEAPGGLIALRADCEGGRVRRVTLTNVPCFAGQLNAVLEVPGLGLLKVDTAWGGDSFVVVDAKALGFDLTPDEARDLAELGMRITANANKQLGFHHPQHPDWKHISFCLFAGPVTEGPEGLETRHAVAIEPGKIDRSPTGTGLSARLALLHAHGKIRPRVPLKARSLIGSEFTGRIIETGALGDLATVTPEISGRAWISGSTQLMLDPEDPWPRGYRLGDTWPGA